ncbi:MAG TPA: IS1595 family transposase [Stellaceae bacterium]|jgi:transposase-like protein
MNLHQLAKVTADEAEAFKFIEKLRWPDGPFCPHCGATDRIYVLAGVQDKKGRDRHGLKKCGHCRKQFTVRVGSIFEDSPIPLGKWILAIHLMCSSKKGISSNQLKRELGVSYQTAWFLTHRIRMAMTIDPLKSLLGTGEDPIVEIDETFVGGKPKNNFHRKKTAAAGQKTIVMTLIDREGDARTVVVPDTSKETLEAVAKPLVDKSATIMTDGNVSYADLDSYFHGHHAVDHNKQFVRGVIIHTNFAESYHSLLKRGIIGSFHHISAKHMHRYLREFEFRWNSRKATDGERTEAAIKATEGKRLTYKPLTRARRGTLSQMFPDKA